MTASLIPNACVLKKLFAERGVRPSRVRGQNFLVDGGLMRQVVEAAHLDRRDVVLEPGAGTGALTALLAQFAGAVIAVEVDRRLHALAAECLSGIPNVRLIHSDVMGDGGSLVRPVRDAVSAALAASRESRLKVVANLPYAVSTAFIVATLRQEPLPVEMIVTVQKEVAERICAPAGAAAYGYLSVVVQAVARAETLRDISPRAFWPQPEVESSVLRIRPDAALRQEAGDLARLHGVVGALFRHRRKQMGRTLIMAGLAADRDAAARVLSQIGAAASDRCEQLSVPQFVRLAGLLPRQA